MGIKLGFFRTYLYSVIIIGLIGLADAVLTFLRIHLPLYARLVSLLLFLFFFFNIFSMAVFRKTGLPRVAYILPLYYVISYVLFLSLGIYLAITAIIPSWLSLTLIGIQLASSLFEIVFSLYLLTKFSSDQAQ